MITVRLPAMLRHDGPDTIVVEEPVPSIASLVTVLSQRVPGFADRLEDAVLNFAINDELILHDVLRQPLKPGDTVEIVPTISGGASVRSKPIEPVEPVNFPPSSCV